MQTSDLLTIVSIVVAVIVSFYIAKRQGAFVSVSIELVPGITNGTSKEQMKELRKHGIWAVVMGIPLMAHNYYIPLVPYHLRNNGKLPLEDIMLQLSFEKELFDEQVWQQHLKQTFIDNDRHLYGAQVHVKFVNNRCFVEYTIPLLPPNVQMPIFTFFLIQNSKQLRNKVYDVTTYLVSKNLPRPLNSQHFFIVENANDFKELIEASNQTLHKLHKENCPNYPFVPLGARKLIFAPWPWPLFYKLTYRNCKMKKRWSYIISTNVGFNPAIDVNIKVLYQDVGTTTCLIGGFNEKGLPTKTFQIALESLKK